MRRLLVVGEVALALPLLVAAMLSVSTITSFITGWQGYDPDNVLTMRAVLPGARYPDDDSRLRFVQRAVERLSAVSGVREAAVANVTPAISSNAVRAIDVTGQPVNQLSKWPRVDYRLVSSRYFDTLRLPVRSGRAFTDADRKGSEEVAIVSESMALKLWPKGDAIGGRVRLTGGGWIRVVGICGDVVHDWFSGRVPTLYRPMAQAPTDAVVFAVRTAGNPLALAGAARGAVAQIDPAQPVFEIMSGRQVLNDRTISLKYIAAVMSAFAGLALLLALLGIYAVMTYFVSQRSREIGVRMALGATGSDVTWLTLSQGATLTSIGVGIGLVLAVGLSRAMEAGLLGIVSTDIRMTFLIAVVLAATALAATYLPARRAASVDPMIALRSE
jgi:putative ABC transport system permease protein